MRIIETIASLGSGGAETLVKDLSIGLKHKGADVLVLVTDKFTQDTSASYKIELLKAQGIEVKSLNRMPGKKQVLPFIRFLYLMLKFKPDVVHFHSFISGVYLLPCLFLFRRVNFFQTIHNTKNFLGRNGSWVQKHILSKFCQLIYCSDEAGQRLKITYGAGHVISNGISLPNPKNIREKINAEFQITENSIVALNVGRLVEQKNQTLLLELVDKLNKEVYHGKFYLLICGNNNNDEFYNKLMQQHAQMDFKEQVKFIGERNDVTDLMFSSDLYISSSAHEGLPITGLEALSVGVTMVLSPIKEHTSIFDNVNSVLFPKENSAEAFVQLITKLTFTQSKEVIKKMRNDIINKYSIESNVNRHLQVFDRG